MIEVEIPTIKRTKLYFSSEQREKKYRFTKNKSNHNSRHTSLHREDMQEIPVTWWNGIFRHGEALHVPPPTLLGVHFTRLTFLFCFFFLVKYQISHKLTQKRKNHCEKIKKPFNSSFKNFVFKGIFIVSLYILIIYYFFIFGQKLNCLSDDIIIMRKIIIEIQK